MGYGTAADRCFSSDLARHDLAHCLQSSDKNETISSHSFFSGIFGISPTSSVPGQCPMCDARAAAQAMFRGAQGDACGMLGVMPDSAE